MKFEFYCTPFEWQFFDADTIDDAIDSGAQWIGQGKTKQDAVDDWFDTYFEDWWERECDAQGYDMIEAMCVRESILREFGQVETVDDVSALYGEPAF